MLKWMRRLRLSLAVKCQLLFGTALVLIIGAALFAPWRRMQDLTAQLNERAAAAVATHVVAEHVQRYRNLPAQPLESDLHEQQNSVTSKPAPVTVDGQVIIPPRMISLDDAQSSDRTTRFEHSAA